MTREVHVYSLLHAWCDTLELTEEAKSELQFGLSHWRTIMHSQYGIVPPL